MKNKLYILTFFLTLAIMLNLFSQVSDFYKGFKAGFNGREADGVRFETLMIALSPLSMSEKPTQLYNEQTGERMPGRIKNCAIQVEQYRDKLVFVIFDSVMLLFAFLCFPALITMAICFIKVIHSVSKNQIFEWKNVRRLRWMGFSFLLLFLFALSAGLYNYSLATELVEIPGYKITLAHMLDISLLLFGLVALIIAEIYSIGLKLKEEEELTI